MCTIAGKYCYTGSENVWFLTTTGLTLNNSHGIIGTVFPRIRAPPPRIVAQCATIRVQTHMVFCIFLIRAHACLVAHARTSTSLVWKWTVRRAARKWKTPLQVQESEATPLRD